MNTHDMGVSEPNGTANTDNGPETATSKVSLLSDVVIVESAAHSTTAEGKGRFGQVQPQRTTIAEATGFFTGHAFGLKTPIMLTRAEGKDGKFLADTWSPTVVTENKADFQAQWREEVMRAFAVWAETEAGSKAIERAKASYAKGPTAKGNTASALEL